MEFVVGEVWWYVVGNVVVDCVGFDVVDVEEGMKVLVGVGVEVFGVFD